MHDRGPTATPDPVCVTAYVGLGANVGDAGATLHDAIRQCAALPQTRLVGRSSFYRTAPVDALGDDFLNAAVALSTRLGPFELLRCLNEIEAAHGRERPFRNAPRTLDLDLLLYGESVITTPRLTVPHPRLHERAFVLCPLAELDAALRIPGLGSLEPLLAAAAGQRVDRLGA